LFQEYLIDFANQLLPMRRILSSFLLIKNVDETISLLIDFFCVEDSKESKW